MHWITSAMTVQSLIAIIAGQNAQMLVGLCRWASLTSIFFAGGIACWSLWTGRYDAAALSDTSWPTDRGERSAIWMHRAIQLAIVPWGVVATWGLMRGVLGLPQPDLQLLDGIALAIVGIAILGGVACPGFSLSMATFYAFALVALGVGWIQRDYSPPRFFVWGISCDLAAFLLISALLGWSIPRIRIRIQRSSATRTIDVESAAWFSWTQACFAVPPTLLAIWISNDFGFDEIGQGQALFGLSGRLTGCMAALMLLGATILMAWQTRGKCRVGWQYAAMASGVLFTGSFGWSQMDGQALQVAGQTAWPDRLFTLMISMGMMTLMSGIGLGRFLPRQSDWIIRGRQAMPVFGSAAMLLLILVLIQQFC